LNYQSKIILENISPFNTAAILSKTLNNRFLRERGMASTSKMEYVPGFSLHFPKELSYGYLRFEGNGKNSFGKAHNVLEIIFLYLVSLNFGATFSKFKSKKIKTPCPVT
jgi:hypothetical protein